MPAHQPGVSYTVQVRPKGAAHWSTIAVGRPEPNLEVDRNQFPGARRARVRVLRTTGFEEEIVADQEVDLAAEGLEQRTTGSKEEVVAEQEVNLAAEGQE